MCHFDPKLNVIAHRVEQTLETSNYKPIFPDKPVSLRWHAAVVQTIILQVIQFDPFDRSNRVDWVMESSYPALIFIWLVF